MPRRRSNRFAYSSTPPKKKLSPIKKLVLRRTSQTPDRTLYQIIRSPPIKPTTFLEESYDQKSPPPFLVQQKKDKLSHQRNPIRKDRQNFNIFGLEKSAGDESEQEEFEAVQRSKKRKRILKRGKKPKEVSPEMMVKLNKEIIDGGYEGIVVIQDTLSLLEQSFSALTNPFLVLTPEGKEYERAGKFAERTQIEGQKDSKQKIDDEFVEDGQRDTVFEMRKDVEPIPKTKLKSKKKVETKAEQNGKVSTPKQDTVVGNIPNSIDVVTVEEDIVMASSSKERLDEKLAKVNFKNNKADSDQHTVSNPEVPAEKVTKSKSTSKSVNFNIDSLLMNTENVVDQDTVSQSEIPVEKENSSPFAFTIQQVERLKSEQHPMNDSTVSATKEKSSTMPNLTNNKLEDDAPKIPPFYFTSEQLERLKSQQLPTHEPIPKGPIAVKLVPQNRSCAPVFIQIAQKDFHRMLPKMPQLQTNNEKC